MQHPLATNAANRLDRLPISKFHKTTLVAVAFAYFFEFADINTFAIGEFLDLRRDVNALAIEEHVIGASFT